MLVCALAADDFSLAWALYDEAFGQRPWKGMQKEFVSRYTAISTASRPSRQDRSRRSKRAPNINSSMRSQGAREEVKPEIDEIDQKSRRSKKLDAVTDPFRTSAATHRHQLQRRDSTVRAKENIAAGGRKKQQKGGEVELPAVRRIPGKSTTQKLNYDQLEKLYNDCAMKRPGLGRKSRLLKEPTELRRSATTISRIT
jgi:hypothetical protein